MSDMITNIYVIYRIYYSRKYLKILSYISKYLYFAIYIACGYFTAHIIKTSCNTRRQQNFWIIDIINGASIIVLTSKGNKLTHISTIRFFCSLKLFLIPCIISRVTTLLHFQHNKNNRIFHLKRNYVSFSLRKNTWNTSFVFQQKVATSTTTNFQV